MKEAELQRACLEMLQASRVGVFWRQNTGAVKIQGAGRKRDRFVRFGVPGQADITGVVDGMRIEIEVKTPGGRLRPSQVEFQDLMVENGALFYVVDALALKAGQKPRADRWTVREVIEDLKIRRSRINGGHICESF